MNLRKSGAAERSLERARSLGARLKAWFPVRVWMRILNTNGLLLSSGVSYQALFATFAALYVGLAVFGVWFVAKEARLDSLIEILNTYIPGLVGDEGAVSRDQLIQLAQQNLAQFGWAGAVALAILAWTASSWITYSRMAIRSVFGLGKDPRPYVLLKGKDLIASLIFGAALLVGTALTTASTNLFSAVSGWLGLEDWSALTNALTRIGGLLLVFLLDTVVLGVMFMTLAGTVLTVRHVAGGALMGGLALTVLQVLGSLILTGGTSNPLLATFVVFVTLLLWFRLTAIVTLTAAAWVAEAAIDRGEPLQSRRRRHPAAAG